MYVLAAWNVDIVYDDSTPDCFFSQFELGPNHAVMGSPLHILLPPALKVGDKIRVQIFYSTTKDCTAVQWLDKESVDCSAWSLLYHLK